MRVLMVSDVYFPRVNGVSTSIETFRAALAASGVEVRLVVPRYRDEREEPGVIRVPGRVVPGDKEDRLPRWRAMHEVVREAARECDLIHVQTPFVAHYSGVNAARTLDLPVLATYHTLFEEYLQHYVPVLPSRWLKPHARALTRRQCNSLDALIVPSTAVYERLQQYGVTAPMHTLPTGIPLDRFVGGDGAQFRARYRISPRRPMALFVGRVAREKNIGFLLDAMHHALELRADLLLVVAGEGPAERDLRNRARREGLEQSVLFIGYLERRRELPACYAAADVFVFASRTETQGLVLLEAMSAGLPVIALSEMGTRDILAPGLGAISPAGEPRIFGAALADFFASPGRRRRAADGARRQAAEWSDVAMAERLATLYRSLLQAPGEFER